MRMNSKYLHKRIVPFRESKLTMIFNEYFNGEQSVSLIVNIWPIAEFIDECKRSLAFACTAREIKTLPFKSNTANNTFLKIGGDESMLLVQNNGNNSNLVLVEENELLRRELFDYQNIIEEQNETIEKMKKEMKNVEKDIKEIYEKIEVKEISNKIEFYQNIVSDVFEGETIFK